MSYIQKVILREVKSLYENLFTDKNLETLIPYNEILMEKTKLSSSSQNKAIPDIDKFTYLISYLSGEVQQYIEDLKVTILSRSDGVIRCTLIIGANVTIGTERSSI